jgi:DNA-binding transcriptional regulator LsrR (DeoR family)
MSFTKEEEEEEIDNPGTVCRVCLRNFDKDGKSSILLG